MKRALANWGPCDPEEPCWADLNGDGVVNGFNSLILISNWGPCPGYCTQQQFQTFSEFKQSKGISSEHWDDYLDVVFGTDERESDRWRCWLKNRLMQCQLCPTCTGTDPFAE